MEIISNITYCDSYENIIKLSHYCVSSSNVTLFECIYDNDEIKSILRIVIGIWASLITVCGTTGNLLTVLAIPHAAKHKRYIFAFYFLFYYNLLLIFLLFLILFIYILSVAVYYLKNMQIP